MSNFVLKEDQALRLKKPLYGTGDGGDYWGMTLDDHVKNGLGLKATACDPSLYAITSLSGRDDDLEGSLGAYVDDHLQAGNKAFQELTNNTVEKFRCSRNTLG